MELPNELPDPLIYGPDFPKLKLVMREGRQRFESTTNQNLRLSPQDFTDRRTYTMARFLTAHGPCRDCAHLVGLGRPDRPFEEAHKCPLVWTIDDRLGRMEPSYADCPSFQILLGYCDTEPQRAFLTSYCRSLTATGFSYAVRDFVEPDYPAIADDAWPRAARATMLRRLSREQQLNYPALIPEVWLNYIGYEKTVEDVEHLRENPQRVDFVMLAEGKRCVIEIDGPSHYADYTPSEGYTVSEERYTKNLRVERSLRRQGWDIYRFSNLEVLRAADNDDTFRQLVADLPGATRQSVDTMAILNAVPEPDDLPL